MTLDTGLTAFQIEQAKQTDEATAFELIDNNEWNLWFEVCHSLRMMVEAGYSLTLDNLKFYLALHRFEQVLVKKRSKQYWKARKKWFKE